MRSHPTTTAAAFATLFALLSTPAVRAAAPAVDLLREPTIAGGDALAAGVAAAIGDVARVGRSDVLDAPADVSPLLAPRSTYFADAATRPAPATGEFACLLLDDQLLDRPALRIVVVDRARLLRLHVERMILQDDAALNTEAIVAAVRRAIEKSRQPVTACALVTPTTVADVERTVAPMVRLVPERIEAALLARPGVFVAETEFARRLLPVPAMDAAPRPWPGGASPWVVTSEYEPARAARANVPQNVPGPNDPRPNVPRLVRPDAPPAAPAWAWPGTLRVSVAHAGVAARTTSMEANSPDLVPFVATRLSQSIDLAGVNADDDRALVDAADAMLSAGEYAAASGLYEWAVAREPSSFALRRSAMVAYLRTNRPRAGQYAAGFEDMTAQPIADGDAELAIDLAAGVHFRALAHLKATVDAPRPAEPRVAGREDDMLLRTIFDPLLDPRAPTPMPGRAVDPREAIAPRLQRYRDALRAMWTEWADARVAAGATDEAQYLRASMAALSPDDRRAAIAAFAARHAAAPDLAERLIAYAGAAGREPRGMPTSTAETSSALKRLESHADPRVAAAAVEAQALARARWQATTQRATAQRAELMERAEARRAATRAVTRPAFDESQPAEITFSAPTTRPRWDGPINAGGRDVVWAGQTISTLNADGTLTTLLENVEPPLDQSSFGAVAYDGKHLWATIRRGRRVSAEPALVVLDLATNRHRVIRAADGLPPTNGDARGRENPWAVLAPLGVGEVAVAGASDRAWIATVRVDGEEMRPSVDVVARLDRETVTAASVDDPRANVPPEAIYAVAPDAAGRPTQLVVSRRMPVFPPAPATQPMMMPPRTLATRSIVVNLADRSLSAIDAPPLTSPDRAYVAGGMLYCVTTRYEDERFPVGSLLMRYDPAARAFAPLEGARFDGYTYAGAALALGDRFAVGTGDALWIADRPEGPYRRLNRPLPSPANGSTTRWLRAMADGRLRIRWIEQEWIGTLTQ